MRDVSEVASISFLYIGAFFDIFHKDHVVVTTPPTKKIKHSPKDPMETSEDITSASSVTANPGAIEDGFIRHSKHYHADGTMVILMSNVYFKLHRSILDCHCKGLASELSYKDARESPHEYDGVPLYVFPGILRDEMRDFSTLVDALYNPK